MHLLTDGWMKQDREAMNMIIGMIASETDIWRDSQTD